MFEVKTNFETVGLMYGKCGPWPIMRLDPAKPNLRAASAVRSPARDAPTMTKSAEVASLPLNGDGLHRANISRSLDLWQL